VFVEISVTAENNCEKQKENGRHLKRRDLSFSPAGSDSPTEGQYCPAAQGMQPARLSVRCLGLKEPMGQGCWLGRAVPAGQ